MSTFAPEIISIPVSFKADENVKISIIPTINGDKRTYNFVDEENEVLHGSASILEDTEHPRPILETEFPKEDLENPKTRLVAQFCARVAVACAVIDTHGRALKGVEYVNQDGMKATEIFPEAHRGASFIGGSAVRGAIPDGFLADVA